VSANIELNSKFNNNFFIFFLKRESLHNSAKQLLLFAIL
jgi:hypothetical protein